MLCHNHSLDRRGFLKAVSVSSLLNRNGARPSHAVDDPKMPATPKLCLFSKHLRWITDFGRLADTVAQLNFEGVDLTVRSGGHISPERVEDDLPKAVEAFRKVGVSIPMITTHIHDPADPLTRKILRTAAGMGIRLYRRDGEDRQGSRDPLKRIADLEKKIRGLVELNREYQMFAGIHNHSGFELGATPWEIYELVKNHSHQWIGSNFDVGHATVEGGLGGWRSGFWLLASALRIQMLAIKDFFWKKNGNQWSPEFCPLGEGMVDFATFFSYLKITKFTGPISMHFEYGLHNRPDSSRESDLLADIRRDQKVIKEWLQKAHLTAGSFGTLADFNAQQLGRGGHPGLGLEA